MVSAVVSRPGDDEPDPETPSTEIFSGLRASVKYWDDYDFLSCTLGKRQNTHRAINMALAQVVNLRIII
jgi:hypothetical protein